MTGKPVILVAMALALSAAGAFAADPAPAPPEEPLICRGSTKQLGSRIRRPRRCKTAEQWRQEEQEKARVPISALVTEGQNDGRTTATPR